MNYRIIARNPFEYKGIYKSLYIARNCVKGVEASQSQRAQNPVTQIKRNTRFQRLAAPNPVKKNTKNSNKNTDFRK